MVLSDEPGSPEAQYWLVNHRIRDEFKLTSEQAEHEMEHRAEEVFIHLKIWELVDKRQKSDQEMEQKRQAFQAQHHRV